MLPIILAVFLAAVPEQPPTLVAPFSTYEECDRARDLMAAELAQVPDAVRLGVEVVCLVPSKGKRV